MMKAAERDHTGVYALLFNYELCSILVISYQKVRRALCYVEQQNKEHAGRFGERYFFQMVARETNFFR